MKLNSNKKPAKGFLILTSAVLLIGASLGAVAFSLAPKEAQSGELKEAGITYGELGHKEAKSIFAAMKDSIPNGAWALDDVSIKKLKGEPWGCIMADGSYGGQWKITGYINGDPLDEAGFQAMGENLLPFGFKQITATESSMATSGDNKMTASITLLDDGRYDTLIFSSCTN